MIATQETDIQHYRGVVCGHCRQPIPLPGIVERLAAADAESPAVDRNIRSFHLRCRVCEREKTYHTGDIVEFEGVPRPRAKARGVVFGPAVRLARAAHV
jgi:hypothetical protein